MRDLLKSSKISRLAKSALGAALGVMLGFLACHEARAANPLELNFWLNGPRYDGNVAPCEKALPTIISQFQEKESTFWNSSLKITAYGNVHETAFRPWQSDNIPRRFCSGQVMVTTASCVPCITRSSRMAVSPASARASNGAWSASTATGPSTPPARPPGPDFRSGRAPAGTPYILFLKCSPAVLGCQRSLV